MDQLKRSPSLLSALCQCFICKNYGTALLYLSILSVALFLISLPLCPWSVKQVMEKFHLKSPAFTQWSLLQAVPSMYNFSNKYALSTTLEDDNIFEQQATTSFQINHYPLRYTSFGLGVRKAFLKRGTTSYIYLRSRYNKEEMTSIYIIEPHQNILGIHQYK